MGVGLGLHRGGSTGADVQKTSNTLPDRPYSNWRDWHMPRNRHEKRCKFKSQSPRSAKLEMQMEVGTARPE